MGTLGEAKLLGGIGSILMLIPPINIIGFILVLVATKYISDAIGDKSVFDNMLYAVITGIVGTIAGIAVFLSGFFAGMFTFGGGALLGIAGLAIVWIFLVISSLFIRRAYGTMATRLDSGSFGTAGTLYFIGAILTIVLVGLLVLAIAFIFQIVAFFSIKENLQPVGARPSPAPPGTPSVGVKFCSYCGAQAATSAAFCPKCGAKLSA